MTEHPAAPTTHEHRLTTAACCIDARAASQERAQPDIGEAQASEIQVGYEAGVRAASQERPPIDVERLARAWELAGYGEVTGDIDQYQEWGGKPREIAEKVAAVYDRLSGSVGEP